MNIRDDIETILTQYAQAIPDLFLEYDREAIQVVLGDNDWNDGRLPFDIVVVLSEDEELLVGEMLLDADFELSYEIFED